jgi:hypothetical protein
VLVLRCGVDEELEYFADLILADDRRAYYHHQTRKPGGQYPVHNILSPDQWKLRVERELLTPRGEFDVGARPGIYRRVWAGWAHRPTCRRRYSLPQDPWRQDYYEDRDDAVSQAWIPSGQREEIVGGQHYLSGPARDRARRYGDARDYGHLTRVQRSRIRNKMTRVSADNPGLKWLLRDVLATHYGVPTWVISRVVTPPR